MRVRGYLSPEKVIIPKRVLCVACKWLGDDDIIFMSEWADGRTEMVHELWNLLDQCDSVLHYNGVRFDIPVINTEFAIAGLPPPSPFSQIDLYRMARSRFSFMSNSLNYVTSQLGTSRKLEHEGMQLWIKVMDGDREAQQRMQEYNIQDVRCNEDLYQYMLPWIPGHPSHAAYNSEEEGGVCCPQCGSDRLMPRGYAYTSVSKYPRFRCENCGKWSRGTRRMSGAQVTAL